MHRYILEPYHGKGSRYACPKCGNRRHTFKRYIDTKTNQPLADHVGKCDREESCGYHCPPREYFAATPGTMPGSFSKPAPAKVFDILPRRHVDDSAKVYFQNNFIRFLSKYLDEHAALKLAELYKIGTSKHWPGATIFWQIDVNDKVRTGKIMLYNETDGHRVKKPFNHINWVHVLSQKSGVLSSESNPDLRVKTQDFRLQQCFFGEPY